MLLILSQSTDSVLYTRRLVGRYLEIIRGGVVLNQAEKNEIVWINRAKRKCVGWSKVSPAKLARSTILTESEAQASRVQISTQTQWSVDLHTPYDDDMLLNVCRDVVNQDCRTSTLERRSLGVRGRRFESNIR